MTRLTDSTDQTESADYRRHIDPPHLWLAVIAGSLAIHLLLALTLRWWSIRVAIAQPSESGVTPVELVEVGPEAISEAASPDDLVATAPEATAQDSATASTPADNATAELEPGVTAMIPNIDSSVLPDVTPAPSPSPELLPPPQASPIVSQPNLPFTPPTLPSSTPIPNQVPNTSQVPPAADNNQAPAPPDSSNGTPPDSSNIPTEPQQPAGELPAENPEPADPSQNPGEDTTGTPDGSTGEAEGEATNNPAPLPTNDGTGEPIAQVPVSQEATPAQFQASLSVSAPTGVGDIPDRLAIPEGTSQSFFSDAASAFGCFLDPESVRYFGQSVTLRIAIDDKGQVVSDATVIQEPSGSSAYDQLARCVISTWKFSPASNRQNEVDVPVFSNLDVKVTISPI